MFTELFDGGEAKVGHLLFADRQKSGHVAVGPTLDQQQLQYFETHVVAAFLGPVRLIDNISLRR